MGGIFCTHISLYKDIQLLTLILVFGIFNSVICTYFDFFYLTLGLCELHLSALTKNAMLLPARLNVCRCCDAQTVVSTHTNAARRRFPPTVSRTWSTSRRRSVSTWQHSSLHRTHSCRPSSGCVSTRSKHVVCTPYASPRSAYCSLVFSGHVQSYFATDWSV